MLAVSSLTQLLWLYLLSLVPAGFGVLMGVAGLVGLHIHPDACPRCCPKTSRTTGPQARWHHRRQLQRTRMKLFRHGPRGHERPGLVDHEGVVRDLSAQIGDICAADLAPSRLARLRSIEIPDAARRRAGHAAVGALARHVQVRLRRPQLQGSRGRGEDAAADRAHPVPEGGQRPDRPERPGRAAAGLRQGRLGGRAGRGDRHPGALRVRGRRAVARRRLLRRQRRLRARLPARARRHLGQGQGLRHLRPGRPLAGHGRRGARPAAAAPVAGRRAASACRTARRPTWCSASRSW